MCELTRRERKKEANRITIMETAIRLFKEQGFEQTTMNQISKEADLSLGTLYNYFVSKESIIGFYVDWVTEQYRKQTWEKLMKLPDTYSRLRLGLEIMARWHEENKQLSEIYISNLRNMCFSPNWEPIPQNALEEIFIELFEIGQRSGDVRKNLEPINLARHLKGVLYSTTLHWHAEPEKGRLVEQYYTGLDVMFSGCGTGQSGVFETLYHMFC